MLTLATLVNGAFRASVTGLTDLNDTLPEKGGFQKAAIKPPFGEN